MGGIFRILIALVFLFALLYLAIQGLTLLFDWFNPGGGSGRVARITTGVVIGLGITIGIIVYRRFMGK